MCRISGLALHNTPEQAYCPIYVTGFHVNEKSHSAPLVAFFYSGCRGFAELTGLPCGPIIFPMTNYSDQRAQREAARQQQSDQNSRDYRRGLLGIDVPSVSGQLGLKQGKQHGSSFDFSHDDSGLPPVERQSQPWLPGLDKWLATVPMRVVIMLGVVGAFCGLGYGLETGGAVDGGLYALGGGFAGLCLIHLLAKLFKLAVGLALIGIVGFAIYYFGFAPSGH